MPRSTEAVAREAKIAEFKRLITSRQYDSLEKLEEAVEAFLWGEEDHTSNALFSSSAPSVMHHQ